MYQWGLKEEEEEILSILWAEEEALLCQEKKLQVALEDLKEEHLSHSPCLKPLSSLPLTLELWEHPHEFLVTIEQRLRSSSMNFNNTFESTMEYQDLNP